MKHLYSFIITGILFLQMTFPAFGSDFPIANNPNLDEECAIAYNSTDHEYLVVWSERIPAGNMYLFGPVMGQRVSEEGLLLGNAFTIFSIGMSPSVAYNPQTNEFLVVVNSQGLVGKRVSNQGVIKGISAFLMEAQIPRILYNSLSNTYLLLGAELKESASGSGSYKIAFYTRKLDLYGNPLGDSRKTVDELAYGTYNVTDSRFSIAYAPIISPETPSGRYLLAFQSFGALGRIYLTMLDSDGAPMDLVTDPSHEGVKYRYIPIDEGNIGGIYNLDVAYGETSGYSMSGPAFFIVWGDNNNRWQNQEWTGIWGSFLDPYKLDYQTTDTIKNNAFPISAIADHWAYGPQAATWKPKVAFNKAAQRYMVAWRETPGSDPMNNAKVNHIRAEKEFEAITMVQNDIISSVNGSENPFSPAIAASTINPYGLIAWEDHRDSLSTNIDIYGSIYKLDAAALITVTAPNGNENWVIGTQQEIRWTSNLVTDPVKIEYSTDGGVSYKNIVNSTANSGSYMWTVPNEPSNKCLIKVSDAADGDPYDVSDAVFIISVGVKYVINTDDSGPGSFRQAILDANSRPGIDTIFFYIKGVTVHSIKLLSSLPPITDPVVISGYTQPGSNVNGNSPENPSNAIIAIVLDGTNAGMNSVGLEVNALNTSIKGLMIEQFTRCGILLKGSGTKISGSIVRFNQKGIVIDSSSNNIIGGKTEADRNVISGNFEEGIDITGDKNIIQGNFIGTLPDGTTNLGNGGMGILIRENSKDNKIGGLEKGAKNKIWLNELNGVEITGNAVGNSIRGNSIFKNVQLGINLSPSGEVPGKVTPNDPGDSDTGPNNLQNYPVISSVQADTNGVFINAALNSTPNTTFQIDIYSSSVMDPSGYGEGETPIGYTEVTTDTQGKADFSTSVGTDVPAGYFVTLTATDPSGNTSEFSNAVQVTNNTPVGNNILVNLGEGVNIEFANITKQGDTKMSIKGDGPPAPGGFRVIPLNSPKFYTITTSAEFSGGIKLEIEYDSKNITPQMEKTLKLLEYETSKWTDITDTVDAATSRISGIAQHLSDFAIMLPAVSESLSVISPNGGENWTAGTQHEIKWKSANIPGKVKIQYSIDGNATHLPIVDSTENDGSYMWTVPDTPSEDCIVIISDAKDGVPHDISNAVFTISQSTVHKILLVTTTQDTGKGSFRQALSDAENMKGPDTIHFAIPKTDAGYNSAQGVWTIYPKSEFTNIYDGGLVIDGFSQSEYLKEDTNPNGPEIVISGNDVKDGNKEGLIIFGDSIEVYGLTINRFKGGCIVLRGSNNSVISGCYLGTDHTGMKSQGNQHGIALWYDCKNVYAGPVDSLDSPGNVISGNYHMGVFISNSSLNTISGNYIGVNRNATDTLGNYTGVFFTYNSFDNKIENNIIGGNYNGIASTQSHNNLIRNNFIGTDKSGKTDLGNQSIGIHIYDSSQSNIIRNNLIKFNKGYGVSPSGKYSLKNTISQNSILLNYEYGIRNWDGANKELTPPVLTSKTATAVKGTAGPGYIVEVFTDDGSQGGVFLGSATADNSGSFTFTLPDTIPLLKNITATCTDKDGNTSEFSKILSVTAAEEYISGSPARFDLRQNYPNPFNPLTTISYELSEDSFVELTLFDVTGKNVKTLLKEFRQKGYHKLNIDLSHLSSGIYFYRLKAGEFIKTLKMTLVK